MRLYLRIMYAIHFNSHARVGRDRTHSGACPGTAHFNSHARVGRDEGIGSGVLFLNNFNSHARVGRDVATSCPSVIESLISTHTPV